MASLTWRFLNREKLLGAGFSFVSAARAAARTALVCEKLYGPHLELNPGVVGQELFTLLVWRRLNNFVGKSESHPSPVLAPRSTTIAYGRIHLTYDYAC